VNRRWLTLPAAAVAATITLSACGANGSLPTTFAPASTPHPSSVSKPPGPSYTPVSPTTALAYVRSHPVPVRPGMTAGIVLNVNVTNAGVITVTIVTATGRQAQAVCGTPAKGCDITDAGKIANLPGTYVYLGGPGVITSSSDIRVITIDAVPGGWS
jgi:hypothetical protein